MTERYPLLTISSLQFAAEHYMRTDRIATVCDAPDQHEYRIVGPDTPPHIAGTYDERTRTVVLGRLPEEPQHE